MNDQNATLVFVYNADSGLFNTMTDIAHKIFSPSTYACNLCKITHGNFQVKEDWKQFIEGLEMPLEFIHRDEFVQEYGMSDLPLPVIMKKTIAGLEPWIDAEAINDCNTIESLKDIILEKLNS